MTTNIKEKGKRKTIIGLSIAVAVLMTSTISLGVVLGIENSTMNNYGTSLENVYQKNLYDLVESVNNVEIKLSKILASKDNNMQKKLLVEVSNNADLAGNSIASLPVSQSSLSDTVRFINQTSGYTKTLAEQVAQGKNLTQKDLSSLEKIRENIVEMKREINKFAEKTQDQYSILTESLNFSGDNNNFTLQISKIKGESVDYPTMIYDGPFSDSQTTVVVKGLNDAEVPKDICYREVSKCFKNVANLEYIGEINSKFDTYNYKLNTTNDQELYVQVTKKGGHIITVSGDANGMAKSINLDNAKKIALDFVAENGIENGVVVWHEVLNNFAYMNIAPQQNGVILYPDLVKVKVDMGSGTVIGYDSTSYFTNHVERSLGGVALTSQQAQQKVPNGFKIIQSRLALAPIDYVGEVLCYEVEAERNGGTYYFYFNVNSGAEENILKVIKTSDSSKLM